MQNQLITFFVLFIITTSTFAQSTTVSLDTTESIDLIRSRVIAMLSGQSDTTPGPYTTQAIQQLNEHGKQLLAEPLLNLAPYDPNKTADPEDPVIGETFSHYFNQLLTLTQCYHAPGGELEGSPDVKQRIEAGLEQGLPYLQPGQPEPGNWHDWLIQQPRALGSIALLMGDELRPNLKNLLLAALNSQLQDMLLTGANAAWEARNHLYLALLENDPARIDAAARKAFSSIYISTTGGIHEDYSYMFHGKIIYTGGYGAGFAQTTSQFIYLFDQTPWAATAEKKDIIAKYLVHHVQWIAFNGYLDLSVRGRGFMSSYSSSRLIEAYILMSRTDTSYKQQITEAALRLLSHQNSVALAIAPLADQINTTNGKHLTGFRYFYTCDLAVFRQPDFYVSVRQFSNRTQDYELLTRKGGKGWNLSNGLTHFTRSGTEWWSPEGDYPIKHADYDRLPGTTSRIGINPPNKVKEIYEKGDSLNFGRSGFSGGAGDDQYGIAGFILIPTHGDFIAHKSYFFFKQGFLALGSNITATADLPQPINTTVAQWATPSADMPLVISDNTTIIPAEQSAAFENIQWAWLDNVGYIFPTPVTLHAKRQHRMTILYLDHGSNPQNETYAYFVLPNATLEQIKAFAADSPIKILANTTTLHAIQNTTNNAVGRVFFTPGTHDNLTVNHPAILYNASGMMALQNPLHTEAKIILSHELSQDTITSTVDTAMGRVYRFGSAVNPPREDLLTFSKFSIDVANTPTRTIFTVHLPTDLGDEPYRLIVHGHKGHNLYELTEKDLIDRPTPYTARYRWLRTIDPELELDESVNQVTGSFRFSIRTDTRHAVTYFSVPAFDENGAELLNVSLPEDSNRPPWTFD